MTAISSWWAASSHAAMGSTTDITTRLALALTPVRSVMRVVDDHVPPMTVEWAGVRDGKSVSATDFANNRVIINPLPIIDQKITTAAALDAVIGFAIHEAAHGKHSRDRFKYLLRRDRYRVGSQWREKEVPVFRPVRIAAYLWNVVEDVRIEQETAKSMPGTAPYFDAVLDYMWTHLEASAVDPAESDIPALAKALRTVFLACRYPNRVMGKVGADEATEVAWWQAWQDDYLSGRIDTPTTIQRGLDHLAQDSDLKKEMDALKGAEAREEAAGERARAQLERMMNEGVTGTYGVCINEDGELTILSKKQAEKIDQLIREGLIEARPIITANGAANPPLHIRKPEETPASRRAYIGKPGAESAALRSALVFRAAAPQFDVKLLRQGVMDDEELYRWGMGDYRVFSERIIEAKPDVFMGLLVDLSGSMAGSKLRTAQKLAQLFVWAMHDQEGVDTQVWGHTGDAGNDTSVVDIFRLWEKGDPMSRLGLIGTLPHANNFDGHAIAYVAKQVMEQPHPQKVVVVLSDGLPSGHGYGGEKGMAHMREVCHWAERNGVKVLQIAIDDELHANDQAKMFGEGNWIPFNNMAALPRQLTTVMSRFL